MDELDKSTMDSHKQGFGHGYREHSRTGTVNAPFDQIKKKLPGADRPIGPH